MVQIDEAPARSLTVRTPFRPVRAQRGFTMNNVLAVLTAIIVMIIVVPLAVMLVSSFWSGNLLVLPGEWTFGNYTDFLTAERTPSDIGSTAVMAFGTSVVALLLGGALAWIVVRTDVPGRSLIIWLPAAPLLLTGLMRDTAWVSLYSPTTGIVNRLVMEVLGLQSAPFNAFSMYGVILSMGFSMYPLSYVILLGPMSAMGQNMEEASRACGAGRLYTLRNVTMPMLRPALISSLLLTSIMAARAFETPIILGLPGDVHVFTSRVYKSIQNTNNFGAAAAEATVYLVAIGILLVWYRRTTRTAAKFVLTDTRGQGGRVALRGWRYPVLGIVGLIVFLTFVLPVLACIYQSLVPYYTVTEPTSFDFSLNHYRDTLSFPGNLQAIRDTLLLALLSALVCVVAALVVSFMAFTTQHRGRRVGDVVGTIPFGFPPVILSVAILVTFLSIPPLVPIYQSIVPLLLVTLVVNLPIALRAVGSAVIGIDPAMREASAACGARGLKTLRSIMLPMLVRPIVGALGVLFLLAFGELGAIILVVPPGVRMLPLQIFTMWERGQVGPVAAMNIITMLIIIGLVLLGRAASAIMARSAVFRHAVPQADTGPGVGPPTALAAK